MKIGIDISQLAYTNTGVANYLQTLIKRLLNFDTKNEYILFFSSMRRDFSIQSLKTQVANKNISIRYFKFPPTFLDFVWNKLHILSIESLIGDVDIFITSDWTEPPTRKAKKATILYDLIVYKYPDETHKKIVDTQKRKLEWVKKESDVIFCISESTKRDAMKILEIDEKRLKVAYPGF